MDLNDIKPPGGNGAAKYLEEVPGKPGAATEAGRTFTLQSQSAAQPQSTGLKAVAQLDKTSLQDPAKLDSAVRASISELIDTGKGLTGPLSDREKEFLTDFLAGDPLMRRQVEALLRKVLT